MEKTKINPSDSKWGNQIACEIKRQLYSVTPASAIIVCSWGAHKFMWGMTDNEEPVLVFTVDGSKFSGDISIIYDAMDYYRVEFVNNKGEVVNYMGEVYFDELTEKIDEFVEKQECYVV